MNRGPENRRCRTVVGVSETLPYPSVDLIQRVGHLGDADGVIERYEAHGRSLHRLVETLATPHVELTGARVLDLGCGAGRVLRHWIGEDGRSHDDATVVGVDVDVPSVEWVNAHLAPAVSAVVGGSRPPLPFDDASFDVVYALSLFTHLDVWWAEWLAEVHRVVRPGGVAVITVLDADQMLPIIGVEAVGDEGMVAVGAGRPWDVGGPIVFHGRWWLEEHWGRGFEIVPDAASNVPTDGRPTGQTAVVLRRPPGAPIAAAVFEEVRAADERESRSARRAREIRAQVQGGPVAFDASHWRAADLRAFIADNDPAFSTVGLDISAIDDMYLAHLGAGATPSEVLRSYFAVGLEVVAVLDRVATWHFDGWDRVGSLFDFAGGYGRVARFLVHRMPAGRVAVGEIQPEALAFQSLTFGVEPVVARVDGIELSDERAFDFVLVVSLFTHLPRATWTSWLARLWERVAPNGILVFSTHNSEPPPPEVTLEDGFWFRAVSEIPRLDTNEYGTTYVSDAFVRSAIADVCGDSAVTTQRLERAFGGIQDVYVVTKSDVAPPPLVLDRSFAVGAVDTAVPRGDGSVRLTGWAAVDSPLATGPVRLTVTVDGRSFDVERSLRRPDVAERAGRPWDLDFVFSGWSVDIPAEVADSDGLLAIEVDEGGASEVLVAGPVRTVIAGLQR